MSPRKHRKSRRRQLTDPAIIKIRAEHGLQTRVAEACGITRQAVGDWDRVPPQHAAKVGDIINMTLHEMRPDIFPAPAEGRKDGKNSARMDGK